ncbi:PspC domain-containing protein [Yinghuangia sp. YIM S09857]|uniref:PspC domain-containing protein n=1 Tax=Yinghuangia sp. YIM S09857 TaxID=3436929 RepID=UPI003F53625D
MNETTPHSSRTPPQAEPGDNGNPPLHRPLHDRVVSGVCGGLGRHFGVDPVIFRVVFAVLALFGGLGVLLYGLGWLLMPADGQHAPLARDVLNGRGIGAAIPAIALTGIGVGVFFSYIDNGFDGAVPLLIVAAIILYVAQQGTRRSQKASGGGAASATAPAESVGMAAAGPAAAATATAPGGAAEPQAAGPASGAGQPLAPGPAKWWRVPTGKSPGRPEPPEEPKPRKPRSYIAVATVSLAAVAGGVLWWLDTATSVDVSVQVGLAVILAVLAGGLLVGTFFGGGRWLIVPAFTVAALLSAVAAITVPFTGPSGERTITPATADTVAASSPYRMKFGEMRLDLTELNLTGRDPADPVRVAATVGAGNMQVYLPEDVRVIIEADVDLGNIDLPNGSSSGYRPDRDAVLPPENGGPPRGTIALDLGVGVGNVEVFYGAP